MEYLLSAYEKRINSLASCLNPYSNGIPSIGYRLTNKLVKYCLNPYSNGIPSI